MQCSAVAEGTGAQSPLLMSFLQDAGVGWMLSSQKWSPRAVSTLVTAEVEENQGRRSWWPFKVNAALVEKLQSFLTSRGEGRKLTSCGSRKGHSTDPFLEDKTLREIPRVGSWPESSSLPPS